jgi:hypothetical protein
MSIEAMKQALDALTNLQPILANGLLTDAQLKFIDPHIDVASTKLHQAIEIAGKQEPVGTKLYTQPAQPVAWTSRELEFIDEMIVVQLNHAERCDSIKNPVAEKQKQWDLERVAILRKAKGMSQREWQGLTDEEIHDEALKLMRQHKSGYVGIARAVESMLKEKNT